jgi:hypothetical protein
MTATLDIVEIVSKADPIAIGGVGGSGTRVVAQLFCELGFDMGKDLNESLDDLSFTALFKRGCLWPPEAHPSELRDALEIYLSARHSPTPCDISPEEQRQRSTAAVALLEREKSWREHGKVSERLPALQQLGAAPTRWGWKEPNTHIFLPFLLRALPNMKYIHVIRSGLDLAFSSNQNQLGLWGKALLGEDTNCASAEDSFRYWCAAHKRLLSLLPHAKERIFLLRFESLVTQPNLVLKELARFLSLEINEQTLQQWHSALEVPATLGRYSGEAPFEIDQDQSQLLAQFGYSIC